MLTEMRELRLESVSVSISHIKLGLEPFTGHYEFDLLCDAPISIVKQEDSVG